MKLIYTASLTLTTDPMLIKRGAAYGNGVIPNDLHVTAIRIELSSVSSVIDVKGIDERSDWLTEPAGTGYVLERIRNDDRLFMYIRAHSGTVYANLHVEGDEK